MYPHEYECVVNFYLSFNNEPVFTEYLPYAPSFHVGEELYLSSKVSSYAADKWRDDLEIDGNFIIKKVKQSFERRYGTTVSGYHFISVELSKKKSKE